MGIHFCRSERIKTGKWFLCHMAGDELICAAADCMRDSFHEYGKVYRISGDEFAVIITENTSQVEELIHGFDSNVANWHGSLLIQWLFRTDGFSAQRETGVVHMKSQKLQMQECIRVRNATIRKAVQTEDRQVTKKPQTGSSSLWLFQGLSGVLPYYFYGKDTSSADMSGDKFFTFSDISFIEVVWDLW